MSRRSNMNSRGRQPPARGPQLKLTFGGKSGQKHGAREITTLARNKKRKAATYSDTESTTSGGESEENGGDEESDEADDESEDPEVDAPSHHADLRGAAGPSQIIQNLELPELGEWTGFPESENDASMHLISVDVQDFEKNLFDSDDDQVYERVNEVSDSDDDNDEAIQRAETDLLAAEFNEDMTSHFANQIDGMSAYGFGDDSDEETSIFFPFSSGDEANESHDRRVRFEDSHSVGLAGAFNALSDSPTMTRALLPSAMPAEPNHIVSDIHHGADADQGDDYDTDATEELAAPAKMWQPIPPTRKSSNEMSPPAPPPVAKRGAGPRGPFRGTFEDEGDKVTAILDPSGTKLVLSDPHLLGGVFARRFGPSAPASPSVGFSDAIFGETDSSQSSESPRPHTAQPITNVDPMFAGLTTGDHATMNGQAIGFPEAFIPTTRASLNDFVSADIFDDDGPDPELNLRIEDMIAFEGDTDTETPDSPILPNIMPASMSAPNTPLAHLNPMNVAAFKRHADTSHFSSPFVDPMKSDLATPSKRKRKSSRFASPYNDRHYHGVTPVQRVTHLEHELASSPAPSSARMHKRRKTIL